MPSSRWNQTHMSVRQRKEGLRGAMETQAGQERPRTGEKEASAGSMHQHKSADPAIVLRRLKDMPQTVLDITILSEGWVPGASALKLPNLLQLNTVLT